MSHAALYFAGCCALLTTVDCYSVELVEQCLSAGILCLALTVVCQGTFGMSCDRLSQPMVLVPCTTCCCFIGAGGDLL